MATPTLGTAFVSIEGRTDKFGPSVEKGVTKSLKGLADKTKLEVKGDTSKFGPSAEPGILSSVKGIAKKAALAFGAAFVIGKGLDFAKGAVQGASDLNESITKIDAVFLTNADTIKEWAKSANRSLGQTQQQALEAAGTFGNLFRAFGIGLAPATDMSKKLVELATDLASFNNSTVDEALLALRSGLSGETEPLKRFGVSLSDDRLKLQALKLGLIKTTKEALLPAAKAQAAYALILADTTIAQGDFARTSAGLANQQRILKATFADIKTQIGTALLPVVLKITTALAKSLPKAFDAIRRSGKQALDVLRPVFKELAIIASAFFNALVVGDVTSDGFVGFVEKIGDALHRLFVALKEVVDFGVSNLVAGFQGFPGDGGLAAKFFQLIGEAARGLFEFLTGPQGAAVVDIVRDKFERMVNFGEATVRFFQENETAASTLQVVLAGLAASIGAIVIGSKGLSAISALRVAFQGIASLLPMILAAGPWALVAAAVVGLAVAGFVAYKKFKPFHDLIDSIIRFFRKFAVPALGVAAALAAILASLTAGPLLIGAVVVGIVAIGAAVFLAYKKFKVFRDIVDRVGRILRTAFVDSFNAVKAAIGSIADFLAPIIESIGRKIGPALKVIGEGIASGFEVAKTVLSDIGGTIRTIVAALSTAAGAIGGFFKTIGEGIAGTAVFKFLVEQAQNFIAFVQEIAPQVVEAFGHVLAVFRVVGKIIGAVFTVISAQVRLFLDIVRETVGIIQALWAKFGKFLTRPLRAAFELILAGIRAALKVLGKVFELGIAAILFVWRKWGDDLARIVKGLFAPIVVIVKLVVNTIANVIRLVLAIINGDWGKAWEAAKRLVLGPIEAIIGLIRGLVDIIAGVLGGIVDTVSGIFHNAWDGVTGIVSAAIDGVVDFVVKLPGRLLGAAGALVSAVAGLFADGWDRFTATAGAGVGAIIDFVTGLPKRIGEAAVALVSTVKGLFGDAWDVLKRVANAAITNIVEFVTGLPARIGTAAVKIFDAFKDIGSKILNGILEGLKSAAGFVGDLAKTIANALVGVINTQVIDRINRALEFTIKGPSFLPDITLDPPDIPHISLAQGGIAKKGRPVSAVIGDNRTRDEVVAPLPPGFLKAMSLIAAGGTAKGTGISVGDVTIVESSDGRSTYADMVRAIRSAQWLAAS